MDRKLEEYFKKHDINYVKHEHPAVFTVEESKFLKSKIPGMHCKSLFLKDEKRKFYLVCMNAFKRLNMKGLRKKMGLSGKLQFASPEELKEELNLTPGSVSIFGMIYAKKTKLIIDLEVWNADIVGFHPNINTSTWEIKHIDLEKFYNSIKAGREIINLDE